MTGKEMIEILTAIIGIICLLIGGRYIFKITLRNQKNILEQKTTNSKKSNQAGRDVINIKINGDKKKIKNENFDLDEWISELVTTKKHEPVNFEDIENKGINKKISFVGIILHIDESQINLTYSEHHMISIVTDNSIYSELLKVGDILNIKGIINSVTMISTVNMSTSIILKNNQLLIVRLENKLYDLKFTINSLNNHKIEIQRDILENIENHELDYFFYVPNSDIAKTTLLEYQNEFNFLADFGCFWMISSWDEFNKIDGWNIGLSGVGCDYLDALIKLTEKE